MTDKPAYVVHHVEEKDVTVDWFFGHGHLATKILQLVLVVVGWFFAILPLVIEISALRHRNDAGGWWNYQEGFDMFDTTMTFLEILIIVFIVGFLALHVIYRVVSRERNRRNTFDEERLELRLSLAEDLYASKYGPQLLRWQERNVRIEPYGDFETYELRDSYRIHGVD
jgi:preprotein translocase subunit SecG